MINPNYTKMSEVQSYVHKIPRKYMQLYCYKKLFYPLINESKHEKQLKQISHKGSVFKQILLPG